MSLKTFVILVIIGSYNGDNSFRKTVTNLHYSFPKNDRKITD